MASYDAPIRDELGLARLRAKQIAEAGLDHSVEHEYSVPETSVLPAGLNMVVFDADAYVIGASADLLDVRPIDPESISYQLEHPKEPEPEPKLPELDSPTERERFQEQAALDK